MSRVPPGAPTVLLVLNGVSKFFSHREGLARGLRSRGYRVEVATPTDGEGRRIVESGYPLHPIPLRRAGLTPWNAARATLALARLYRRRAPDLVHHFTPKPVIYGGIAARLAGQPATVHSIAGLDYPFTVHSPLALLLRGLSTVGYRLALGGSRTRLIFENSDDRREFTRRGLWRPERSHVVVGAGVDTEKFRPRPEPAGPPTVLLAARMLEQKGVREFAEAARRLRSAGAKARFVLAGSSDPVNPTSIGPDTLEAWDRAGPVDWVGAVPHDEMPGLLAGCHVVCLPSYREGAPKTLIEACASGRPVVATDVPGCRAVIEDGENGLLIPPRDPGALARALRRLVGDAELRRRLGRRGRRRAVETFAVERVVERTAEIYGELLGEPSAGAETAVATTAARRRRADGSGEPTVAAR